MKPVLGVAEVGRIRVTDQRSRVSRRTRGEEEALGPIESAYREQKRGTCLPPPPLAPLFPFVILLLDSFFLSLFLSSLERASFNYFFRDLAGEFSPS